MSASEDRRLAWGGSPASADEGWLRRAFALALRGEGTVSPNPMVGAVVVRGGRIVGEGHHRRPGREHAEVSAIRRAGTKARGATLYVNLEPCSHHGRTPPCVETILAGGIRRVVASMVDPNPRVRGRGFAALKAAGVAVERGLLEAQARRLNEAYIAYIGRRRPFVLIKAGMSLDGKIATASGESRWISSAASRRESRALRWRFDALAVGVETAIADDPELLARRGGRVKERFLRVVLDSHLRLPPGSRLARSASRHPVRVYTTRSAASARERRLVARGVQVVRVASRGGRVDLRRVLQHLGADEIASVLVEGGGELHASFLEAGLADKLRFYVAPVLLGGRSARPVVGGPGASHPQDALRLARWTTRRVGPDLVIEGYPRS